MRRTITIRVLALIALLVGVLVACGPEALGPRETGEKFLTAMVNRQFDTAYELLSPDSQATVTVEDFAKMVNEAWQEAEVTEVKLKFVHDQAVLSFSGKRAALAFTLTLTTGDGKTSDIYNAINLVEYNGRWGVVWPPVR